MSEMIKVKLISKYYDNLQTSYYKIKNIKNLLNSKYY